MHGVIVVHKKEVKEVSVVVLLTVHFALNAAIDMMCSCAHPHNEPPTDAKLDTVADNGDAEVSMCVWGGGSVGGCRCVCIRMWMHMYIYGHAVLCTNGVGLYVCVTITVMCTFPLQNFEDCLRPNGRCFGKRMAAEGHCCNTQS